MSYYKLNAEGYSHTQSIKDMKTFKDLQFEQLIAPDGGIGKRTRMMFDNGYGVSVIQTTMSYGGKEGLYELAVIDDYKGSPIYYTSVTNDVLGHLSEDDVTKHMTEVQELQPSMKTFLSKKQVSKLEEMQWDVISNPSYVKIYADELNHFAWVDLCQTLGVDISVDHVRMLVIAKQVTNY